MDDLDSSYKRRVKMKIFLLVLCMVFSVSAFPESPYLVSPDGKYLGNLSTNKYDANSTSNEYGRYGSEYSADSINNPYGQYGSKYSNKSPNNPYATQAPLIIHRDHY